MPPIWSGEVKTGLQSACHLKDQVPVVPQATMVSGHNIFYRQWSLPSCTLKPPTLNIHVTDTADL